jgi:DNA-binding winged helix-turn-helix (wHTH) protein
MTVGQDTRSSSRLIRFGVFEAYLRSGELRKNGLKVRLPGQPFEVLAMMLERPGEVVTREELQKRLWPDGTFVDFDHSLNNAINKIREVLGDSAESPRFVETLARRGYRFIAPVETLDLQSPMLPSGGRGPRLESGVAASLNRRPSTKASGHRTAGSMFITLGKLHWLSRRARLLAPVCFFSWWWLFFSGGRCVPGSSARTSHPAADLDPGLTDAVQRRKDQLLLKGRKQSRHLDKAGLRRSPDWLLRILQTITSLHSLPTAARSSFDRSGRVGGSTLFQHWAAKAGFWLRRDAILDSRRLEIGSPFGRDPSRVIRSELKPERSF